MDTGLRLDKVLFAMLLLVASLGYQPLTVAQSAEAQNAVIQESIKVDVDESASLSDQVEQLKQQVLDLNRDLFILEEELLFPASTQIAVFLSVDVGQFFALDSVELKIDGQTVTHYLYTERQVKALAKGGVQRLYLGNLRSGSHEITAFFLGKDPEGRDVKRGVTRQIEKQTTAKRLELRIVDASENYQADFEIVDWD